MTTRKATIAGIILATTALISACGQKGSSASAVQGVNVNNGPGPVGDILVCNDPADSNVRFTVRHTAAVTLIQGLLEQGDDATSMKCDRSRNHPAGGADVPATLWQCAEMRQGEGLYRVNIHSQGLSALVLADVTIDQIFPLPPQKIATLVCQEPAN